MAVLSGSSTAKIPKRQRKLRKNNEESKASNGLKCSKKLGT